MVWASACIAEFTSASGKIGIAVRYAAGFRISLEANEVGEGPRALRSRQRPCPGSPLPVQGAGRQRASQTRRPGEGRS